MLPRLMGWHHCSTPAQGGVPLVQRFFWKMVPSPRLKYAGRHLFMRQRVKVYSLAQTSFLAVAYINQFASGTVVHYYSNLWLSLWSIHKRLHSKNIINKEKINESALLIACWHFTFVVFFPTFRACFVKICHVAWRHVRLSKCCQKRLLRDVPCLPMHFLSLQLLKAANQSDADDDSLFPGKAACVEALLAWGADVDYEIPHLGTPLYIACVSQELQCTRTLLDGGTCTFVWTTSWTRRGQTLNRVDGIPVHPTLHY